MWDTLKVPGKEWRRLYKGVNLAEHLLKFGAPQCVQEIRDEAFKIRQLVEFSYMEDGTERGQGSNPHSVRDKARLINILVADFQQLEAEREAARQLSNRFVGISSEEYYTGGGRAAYAPSAGSAYQPASETASQRAGLGVGPASSQWSPNTRGFEPPQYNQGNRETAGGLFEPPKQTQSSAGLFEPPRQQEREFNIFDPKPQSLPQLKPQQPAEARPAASPTIDIFTLPAKPKADLFSLPKPNSAPKDPPSDLFSLPKTTPKDPPTDLFSAPKPASSDLFSVPKPTPKPPSSDLFSVSKAQSKSALPPSESIRSPLPTPAVTSKPPTPSVSSALDGLFTPQPAGKSGAIPAGQQYAGYTQGTALQTFKIHHNMETSPMPTLSELKTSPSLAQPTAAAPLPKRKAGDVESFLVDLDNLQIEASLEKRENTHLEGFGVASGKRV